MQEFFFDLPWWVPAGILVAGAGVWIWGNNRLRVQEKRIGLGLLLLAGALSLVSYLVDTPAETVARLTREFVSAVVAQDGAKTAALLHPDAVAFNWDRQDIIDGARYYAERTGLTKARVSGLEVAKEDDELASYLGVWSDHSGGSEMPATFLTSQWKLIWMSAGSDWRLVEIVPLQIATITREQIQQRYLDRPAPGRQNAKCPMTNDQ